MQIKTAAVNSDTWNLTLHQICKQMVSMLLYLMYGSQDLLDDIFQGILTSPEMCLKHDTFCKILTDENFSNNICTIIVDEAHCISQWGGDFRKLYALLQKLQVFFPPNIPFLSALFHLWHCEMFSDFPTQTPSYYLLMALWNRNRQHDMTDVTQWGVAETKCTRHYGAISAQFQKKCQINSHREPNIQMGMRLHHIIFITY